MKIGFFGTPEIAAYCLGELLNEFEVTFVVTGEDKERGRHLKVQDGPVKALAAEKGIPVYQPARLRDPEFIQAIAKHDADLYVVVAYGKIIPAEVFSRPRLKTINLHPSLLPKYRGAAPVQWALINGENETGITVQTINERLDAGDVLLQTRIPLDESMCAEDLYRIVLPEGARLLRETVRGLSAGAITPVAQNEDEATFCPKIDRDTAHIEWQLPAVRIHNLVRGLNPKPVAWTTFRGKNMKIWKTAPCPDIADPRPGPGELAVFQKKRLLAGTGDGVLEILQIQPETKKIMDGLSFINGYRLAAGEKFA